MTHREAEEIVRNIIFYAPYTQDEKIKILADLIVKAQSDSSMRVYKNEELI